MASWATVEAEAPGLASRVRGYFDAHVHKTLATVRLDGSPRISGTETRFADGELWLGSMWRAKKALDLRRDPRFALHSGSDDPPAWRGDAKVAGSVEEILDPERVEGINGGDVGRSHLFRADITEVVVVRLSEGEDRLVVESWHEGRGVERRERT